MPGRTATAEPPAMPLAARGTSLRHALPALAAAAAALLLAWHHPLSPLLALLGAAAVAALTAWRLTAGLALPLLLLPLLDLMPWSGWITFNELDIALLAAAAGGYARRALAPGAPPQADGATRLKGLVVLAYAVALLVSLLRGFDDAGGFVFGWWQGYHEPMNSLRVARSFFLALLLLPLWRLALRREPQAATRALSLALAGALVLTALLVMWDRSLDARPFDFGIGDRPVTAFFWEMHVGGAALDGFLVLTLPFAVRELLAAVSVPLRTLAALAVLLGVYVCLAASSTGAYLGLPLGLALMAGLDLWQRRRAATAPAVPLAPRQHGAVIGWLAFTAGALLAYPSSEWRGLAALFGAMLLVLPMAHWLRPLRSKGWVAGGIVGVVVALLLGGVAAALPKGPYAAYAIAWVAAALVLLALERWPPMRGASGPAVLVLAAFLGVLSTLPQIAWHCCGSAGIEPIAGAALLLLGLAVYAAGGDVARWSPSLRWQARQAALVGCTALVVAVLLGGDSLASRYAAGGGDFAQRVLHWKRAYWLISGPWDWLFGKGTGRYPDNQFMSGFTDDQVGDYRLRNDDGAAPYLVLSGGRHALGADAVLRVSQRIGDAPGPVRLQLQLRSSTGATLAFEVCRKHLLRDAGCSRATARVDAAAAAPGRWQTLDVTLPAAPRSGGQVLSLAVESLASSVEIARVTAVDAQGRQRVVNGDFAAGLAHWYVTSDRYHLPWHLLSLPLHLLFEQGVVGALLFGALGVGAIWRTTVGTARDHALAPAIAAALSGAAVVGLFDSLLDAPRIACLLALLMLLGLTLPARRGATRQARAAA